jgi:hypothetical protein
MHQPKTDSGPEHELFGEGESGSGTCVGWVTGLDAEGDLWVDFEGNPSGPLRARRAVPLDATALREAVTSRQSVVLLRGVNIRTEAEELQRIKGGKVQIN